MSPRWFNRRTYRIVASGRSALTFNAAMSASSASTTIRSAFLLTLSPTVKCHDIFGLPQSYGRLPTIAQRHRPPCVRPWSSFMPVFRVAAHSARTPIFTNREWGGRWFNWHHMLHGPPHGALHVLALVNNGARISQMAIPSSHHKRPRSRRNLQSSLYWPPTETPFWSPVFCQGNQFGLATASGGTEGRLGRTPRRLINWLRRLLWALDTHPVPMTKQP